MYTGSMSTAVPFPSRTRITTAAPCIRNKTIARSISVTSPDLVVERRAADVAVIGNDTSAVLAAYALAKTGRKVLVLPSFGLSAATPVPSCRPLQCPVKLADVDPLLVYLAVESAAYWRGLEMQASCTSLSQQQTLDVVEQPDSDHAGAAGFSKLQEACAAVGVPTDILSSSEATATFRQLRLPHSSTCLLQSQGGLLEPGKAAAAARQMAQQAGVQIMWHLVLRGWRDRGSCFELRTSTPASPDLLSLLEAEVLLLAPSFWHSSCLALFGLQLQGLQTREVLACQVAAGSDAAGLPVVQSWGAAAATDAAGQAAAGGAVIAHSPGAPTRLCVQQLPAWGWPVPDPLTWQPARPSATLPGAEPAGGDHTQQTTVTSSSSTSRDLWVDTQVRQLYQSCARLVRAAGPLDTLAGIHSSVISTVNDGRPIVGWHPGFEAGRVVVCCAASGDQQYGPGSCSSSYQLSPMLAKLAADLIRSAGGPAADGGDTAVVGGLAVTRACLESNVDVGAMDAWAGLAELQQPRPVSASDLERAEDEAADNKQDVVNAQF